MRQQAQIFQSAIDTQNQSIAALTEREQTLAAINSDLATKAKQRQAKSQPIQREIITVQTECADENISDVFPGGLIDLLRDN